MIRGRKRNREFQKEREIKDIEKGKVRGVHAHTGEQKEGARRVVLCVKVSSRNFSPSFISIILW